MMSSLQIEQLRTKANEGQPQAQFLLSQICHQKRDFDGMVYWLQRASANDLPDALNALGHCHETGLGVARDFASALAHYDKAINRGAIYAAFRKAVLLYKSRRGPDNEDIIRELLVLAADANIVEALRTIGYLAMHRESSRSLALESLRRAAGLGDPVSSFNLGWCLCQGWGGADAEGESVLWLQYAAGMNYPFAESLLASLEGVSPARPGGLAENKTELNTSFPLYPSRLEVDRQILSADPAITIFKDVLNTVDCAHLIFVSRPLLQRADVIDPTSQKGGMISDVRTNLSTFLPFGNVDVISRHIELKIICETGEDLALSEPMSILFYAPGEFYRPHVDYFNPNLTVSRGLMEDGGQRTSSAITYLSEPLAGGGTSFPKLKLTAPPRVGSTLWFRNCHAGGQIDDRTLHAGDPVVQGEKWVVTKWFRQRPTRYIEF